MSFVDVTERELAAQEIRRLNRELEQSVVTRTEQLDAATRELEALAYSMAHDVRTPLRTIDGFSAIVLEEEAGRLSADGVENLERVRAAAQTLARLMDDLMGLSRVSRHDLVRQTADLTRVAQEVCEELAAEHAGRAVDFSVGARTHGGGGPPSCAPHLPRAPQQRLEVHRAARHGVRGGGRRRR